LTPFSLFLGWRTIWSTDVAIGVLLAQRRVMPCSSREGQGGPEDLVDDPDRQGPV
jgi:hypothetical protein